MHAGAGACAQKQTHVFILGYAKKDFFFRLTEGSTVALRASALPLGHSGENERVYVWSRWVV